MDLTLSIIFTLVIVFGGLLVAAGWFFFNLGRKARDLDRQIAEEGVAGEAEVTNRRVEAGKTNSYYLTFTYAAANAAGERETFVTETLVNGADYERLKLGDKVPIRYLPKTPKEMVVQGGVDDEVEGRFFTLGIAVMAAGAALIILILVLIARMPR